MAYSIKTLDGIYGNINEQSRYWYLNNMNCYGALLGLSKMNNQGRREFMLDLFEGAISGNDNLGCSYDTRDEFLKGLSSSIREKLWILLTDENEENSVKC